MSALPVCQYCGKEISTSIGIRGEDMRPVCLPCTAKRLQRKDFKNMAQAVLTPVDKPERKKTAQEIEVERLMELSAADLNAEDLRILQRIRDCRASLLEIEAQLDEAKEVKKSRQAALDLAILNASQHFDNRQMALNFGRG